MNYKSKTRKHSFLTAGKKHTHTDNCICQVKISKKLILHFIRKPDEERKYHTNVDTMTVIQVTALSHYATVTKRVKLMAGYVASQDTR